MNLNTPMNEEDCRRLLVTCATPPHVVRHCEAVANVSKNIARALNAAGFGLDETLAYRAGLLHDIARHHENHAEAGADIVAEFDAAAADIIRDHMTHSFPDVDELRIGDISESDIVSLADRSVSEDVYIGYENRMMEIMRRTKGNADATERIRGHLEKTRRFVASLEQAAGIGIDDIASGGIIDITPLLLSVEKPGRYVGGEVNSCYKDPAEVKLNFCFAFPDLYEIGMSYTGMQIIYGMLNENTDILCERVFAPATDMEAAMREREIPLFMLETCRAVKKADIVGFTLQYEHSYTNIVNMLDLAGIPLYSRERGEDYPLVIAGGPCAYNPEPLADIFDIVALGDGEELLPDICEAVIRHKDERPEGGREELLLQLAAIEGVYVPSFYQPNYSTDESSVFIGFTKKYEHLPDKVKRRMLPSLDEAYYPSNPVIPLIEGVHERAVVEIFRGCGRGCRFCQAGFVYRPVRRRSPEKIKELLFTALDNTGYDEASLLSLSTGDYPKIEQLIFDLTEELTARDVSLSLPSLRLDSISQEVLTRIGDYRRSGLTFAPEAGTQRMRDIINKKITEADIFRAAETAAKSGYSNIKFYFMIGLPFETEEDIRGIAELSKEVVRHARFFQEGGKKNFALTVSVSNFVPKPNTPFQWAAGNSEETLIGKIYLLKDMFKGAKGITFRFHDTRVSRIEMFLAKGDRRALSAIVSAVRAGAKFDSWREHFDYGRWMDAIRETGMPDFTAIYADPAMPLPWDIADSGTDKEFLQSEYQKSLLLGSIPDKTEM